MEKLTINIRRCKDCECWDRGFVKYGMRYEDDSHHGFCSRKQLVTQDLDACIDTTDIRNHGYFSVLYADDGSANIVYGLGIGKND